MGEWTKVVTSPLGLVGFVLFLAFGLLAKVKQRDERRWLMPAAMVLGLIALVGGLSLAYVQVKALQPAPAISGQTTPLTATSKPQRTSSIQESHGDASPNFKDVQGTITVINDQSSTNTDSQHAAKKKPQDKKSQ